MLQVCKTFEFAAHHKLPYHQGKCSQDHGHNYVVTVCVSGKVRSEDYRENVLNGDAGMILDFNVLKDMWSTVEEEFLDHRSLNDILENPTAENFTLWLVYELQRYLWDNINKPTVRHDYYVSLSKVTVRETGDSFVEWEEQPWQQ